MTVQLISIFIVDYYVNRYFRYRFRLIPLLVAIFIECHLLRLFLLPTDEVFADDVAVNVIVTFIDIRLKMYVVIDISMAIGYILLLLYISIVTVIVADIDFF